MDTNLSTALIAAGSACLGALIPCLFSYFGKRQEFNNNRKTQLDDIRRNAFKDFIKALQTMMNDGSKNSFLTLQESVNNLLLFAGPKLSSSVNEFYTILIQRTIQGNPLTEEEQTKYRTDIINAMRKEIGISDDELKKVTMIKAG